MKVLVTGANGMLGQDLCPILRNNGYEVVETDIHNLDITNIEICEKIISNTKPKIVIHCAAYTNVDKAEEDINSAIRINILGTENITKICSKYNIKFVYISTDYVFDGTKTTPYNINDIPNPINNYGLTKLKGENIVKRFCNKYYIIRTSWLYGEHGKNFVDTMISLSQTKNQIRVVDNQIGCPTWTVELSNGIVKILENESYGIFHVCGKGQTSWYEFAKEIFRILSINTILSPCKTNDFQRPAKRPQYSVLESYEICSDWKLSLKEYLKSKKNS